MRGTPQRRVIIQYGSEPPERVLRSAEAAARCNAVIGEQQSDLAVGTFGGADHAAAFDAAERHRLEVCNDKDLLAD